MNNKMKPVMNNLKAKISKTVGYKKKKSLKIIKSIHR